MKYLFVCISFFGIISCQGPIPATELNTWLGESSNGCMQMQDGQGYSALMQFLPAELMAYKQLNILEERYDDSAFDALTDEFRKGVHFKYTLDFSKMPDGAKNFYNAHQDYMNFYIGDDLQLISGLDTIPCSIANMERGANFSPKINYELAFDYPINQVADDLIVHYEGELGENPFTFTFSKSDLNRIPQIKR